MLLLSLSLFVLLIKVLGIVFLVLVLLVAIDIINKEQFKIYLRRVSLVVIFVMILVLFYGIVTTIPW